MPVYCVYKCEIGTINHRQWSRIRISISNVVETYYIIVLFFLSDLPAGLMNRERATCINHALMKMRFLKFEFCSYEVQLVQQQVVNIHAWKIWSLQCSSPHCSAVNRKDFGVKDSEVWNGSSSTMRELASLFPYYTKNWIVMMGTILSYGWEVEFVWRMVNSANGVE